MLNGIGQREIASTPLAVVDVETTGLYAGGDRIVEIAIVRADPGRPATLVLDTLVNPGQRVTATEIHGIRDEDVVDAPRFDDLASLVVQALEGAVFASYNVYFDARFVRDELRRAGVAGFPPHLCLMYLRPMLSLGRKCSLRDACAQAGVNHAHEHRAAGDALAAAALWTRYLEACGRRGLRTFSELARLHAYKFTSTFDDALLGATAAPAGRAPARLKARAEQPAAGATAPLAAPGRQEGLAAYWDALAAAVADLDVTPHEIFYLKAKQAALALRPDELRWMHARLFAGLLADMCQDKAVTDDEAAALGRVAAALRELGWAPGDDPARPRDW